MRRKTARTGRSRTADRSCKTGKARYRDKIAALLALETIATKGVERLVNGEVKKPVRAYHCTQCKGWHLTSMR